MLTIILNLNKQHTKKIISTIDSLTSKSHLLNMSGDSYHVEETIKWMKK